MLNFINKDVSKFILSIFFFLIIIFIINNELVSKIIWWFPDLFGDYKLPIKWLECTNLGFNFFEDKEAFIGCSKRGFLYGKIFLEIPYTDSLNYFYNNILPYIIIYLSIYLIVKIFNTLSLISLFVLTLAILNPSTFFLFSSLNIDVLIFILLIFTSLNRVYFINWFIYFFLTFVKIYPIILFLGIFFENYKRSIWRIITIFVVLFILSLTYFYFNYSEYTYMLSNLSGAKAGYHYLFSLNSFAKIGKYLFNLNYVFLLFITYSIFFYLVAKAYKKINLDLSKIDDLNIFFYSSEFKLFIISCYMSITCYVFFSNFFHREIFLIGTLPLIFKLDEIFKRFPLKLIINLYLVKLIYSYIYSYFNVSDGIQYIDDERVFSSLFIIIITIKSAIDYFLMIMISALSFYYTHIFYNNFKNKILRLR